VFSPTICHRQATQRCVVFSQRRDGNFFHHIFDKAKTINDILLRDMPLTKRQTLTERRLVKIAERILANKSRNASPQSYQWSLPVSGML